MCTCEGWLEHSGYEGPLHINSNTRFTSTAARPAAKWGPPRPARARRRSSGGCRPGRAAGTGRRRRTWHAAATHPPSRRKAAPPCLSWRGRSAGCRSWRRCGSQRRWRGRWGPSQTRRCARRRGWRPPRGQDGCKQQGARVLGSEAGHGTGRRSMRRPAAGAAAARQQGACPRWRTLRRLLRRPRRNTEGCRAPCCGGIPAQPAPPLEAALITAPHRLGVHRKDQGAAGRQVGAVHLQQLRHGGRGGARGSRGLFAAGFSQREGGGDQTPQQTDSSRPVTQQGRCPASQTATRPPAPAQRTETQPSCQARGVLKQRSWQQPPMVQLLSPYSLPSAVAEWS